MSGFSTSVGWTDSTSLSHSSLPFFPGEQRERDTWSEQYLQP